jgi:DNA replication initiation complex subunit (GINS family)
MVEFSYEDLYEILRAEKYSTDLQPLEPAQIRKIANYLKLKEEFLVRQKDSSFDENVERVKIELENAKRALRDIYDRRERKIINRALFTAKGGFKLKDTTNMLVSEEKLYTALLELLKRSGEEFFSLFDHDFVEDNPPKNLKTELKRVRILEALPELLDTSLKRYGPFEPNTITDLPEELADLLLKQGKAVEVKVENENPKTS